MSHNYASMKFFQKLSADMPLVGAFLFPHGTITLDPETRDFSTAVVKAVKPESRRECVDLHNAMKSVASELIETRPDLVIFSTPHGPRLQNNYVLIGNSKASGNAEWDKDWIDFKADMIIDDKSTGILYEHLKRANNPVDMFRIGMPNDDVIQLRWGEVVPWWFVMRAAETRNADDPLPPVVLIGQPSKRVQSSRACIAELLKLGSDIGRSLATDVVLAERRVAVVISGDLSHLHSTSVDSPFKYDPVSENFDRLCEEWCQLDACKETSTLSDEKLLHQAGSLVDEAASCGYTGMVMLHGLLQHCVKNGANFRARCHAYRAPTYYGMTAASWKPV